MGGAAHVAHGLTAERSPLTVRPTWVAERPAPAGFLPWGRVGVREVYTCEGYEHDVAHDVALLILSRPVPAAVPTFEIAFDIPKEAGIFELAGFGTDTKPREIPLTGWDVTSVTRHLYRGSVQASCRADEPTPPTRRARS